MIDDRHTSGDRDRMSRGGRWYFSSRSGWVKALAVAIALSAGIAAVAPHLARAIDRNRDARGVERAIEARQYGRAYDLMEKLQRTGGASPFVVRAPYFSPGFARYVADRWLTGPGPLPGWGAMVIYSVIADRSITESEVVSLVAALKAKGKDRPGPVNPGGTSDASFARGLERQLPFRDGPRWAQGKQDSKGTAKPRIQIQFP